MVLWLLFIMFVWQKKEYYIYFDSALLKRKNNSGGWAYVKQ